MSINTPEAGISGAITGAVLWILCSAWFAFLPMSSPHNVLAALFHLHMPTAANGSSMSAGGMMPGGGSMSANPMVAGVQTMSWGVTWDGFLIGLIVWSAVIAVSCALYAAIYNRRTR